MNRLIRHQIDFSLVGFKVIDNSVNGGIDNKHRCKSSSDIKALAHRNWQHYHERLAKRMYYQSYDIIVFVHFVGSVFLPPRLLLKQCKLALQIIVIYDMAKHH